MWVVYALASAFFAGIVSILAKIGIKNTNSDLAMALRTIVIIIFAWLMVFVVGSQSTIPSIDAKSLIFLVLSGLATGGSWLYYFKALQIGDINKVVPVEKSSLILTMLLAFIFLNEGLTPLKAVSMVLIGIGTYLMIERKATISPGVEPQESEAKAILPKDMKGYRWLIYATLSAIFASLTAILGKVGIEGVESNLGTAIRTIVILIMAWLIVLWQGKHKEIKYIDKRSWIFIALSGLATGLSWLCYYRALQEGPASVVVPIDKLSILVSIAFGYFVLHEKLRKQSVLGLILIVLGTLNLLI